MTTTKISKKELRKLYKKRAKDMIKEAELKRFREGIRNWLIRWYVAQKIANEIFNNEPLPNKSPKRKQS